MLHISSILHHFCKDVGLEEKIILQQIEEEWHNIFSRPLSLHTWPADLKDGELTINVNSPVWLQELKFLQPMILKKLDKYRLKSVRLRLGKIKSSSKAKGPNLKHNSPLLSSSDVEWLNKLLAGIQDAELRECIKRAAQNSLYYNNCRSLRGRQKKSTN